MRRNRPGPAIVDIYRPEIKGYGLGWSGVQLLTQWLPKHCNMPFDVPMLSGIFLAVRRSVFQSLGGFDTGMVGVGV
jgi:GT2 family glycosyltransferase